MKGRTLILIAHMMSTIVNADMIVVVQIGQVTETGTHSNLLQTSEFYSDLFSMQNIRTKGESRSILTPMHLISFMSENKTISSGAKEKVWVGIQRYSEMN